jgi:hypothetical protein
VETRGKALGKHIKPAEAFFVLAPICFLNHGTTLQAQGFMPLTIFIKTGCFIAGQRHSLFFKPIFVERTLGVGP